MSAAALDGDRAAVTELHHRLHRGLTGFFLKRRPDADLADELAQRTWIEVWGALRDGRYDPQRAAVSTFVYAIGYKIWLRHLRQTRGTTHALDSVDAYALSALRETHDPARVLETCELLDAVRSCIHAADTPNSLTETERRIVAGTANGESERSLAAELGVAPSTINARKRLAYNKLRKCLAAKGHAAGFVERARGKRE